MLMDAQLDLPDNWDKLSGRRSNKSVLKTGNMHLGEFYLSWGRKLIANGISCDRLTARLLLVHRASALSTMRLSFTFAHGLFTTHRS